MRRTRRHKFFQISVFFLIYSIIHVMSVNKDEDGSDVATTKAPHHELVDHLVHTGSASVHKGISDKSATTKAPHHELVDHLVHTGSASVHKGISDKDTTTKAPHHELVDHLVHTGSASVHKGISEENKTTKAPHHELVDHLMHTGSAAVHKGITGSTKHPITESTEMKNNKSDCPPAAIEQFPQDLLGQRARANGGIIIHIVVAIYMFLGLAIVCDEYFVASLDRICEELKMSPDVAGATFMAAGSSAPELATVVIGVFFAKDDIGISGVIGSAVFNIMFVISCCGLVSTTVIYLNWWPLIRDCFFYAVSILIMLVVIYNEEISWGESLVMLITYLIYCVVLHFNTPLEKWVQTLPVPFKQTPPNEQSGLVSYKTLEETQNKYPSYGMEWSPDKQQQPQENPNDPGENYNFGMEWSPEKHQESFANQLSGPALNQAANEPPAPQAAPPVRPNQHDYYIPKAYDPSTQVNPLIKPEEAGVLRLTFWGAVYPIHWLCRKTMPDCRSEPYKNWYPFTFFISMLWISFYSYFMVWMITVIGYTMHIPDTVMGLTFVAAGVSVPDALSSIAVIKEGYGDMAVSNAVGSNVFDILICLGLPWFLKTAIINPGGKVKVRSKGLTYSTLSLLSTVVFLVVATHLNGWKLDRRYGVILMVWYLIFITFASMYELNVFGKMNPPNCEIANKDL